ncbi:XRE family transcriptional regulator [Labrys wisconsinensis]|uniref:Zn-dependent peptidase ImmA (M78 family)/DNA-binding XRE family transcriptional regulator n=1 Tax=Labrys wisconsinensis TaxID=425677 RepID=A0ABU0JGL9_9HYPH|nr:XRE family transcriptional regulator [Labrys wisconsinensis]MDQ0473440.1 Zn-dependent peptidase ImmA (M78 family)/DNA-binding XRE family transcriptional regulator [Labrys wisconsinensis]
MARSIAAIVEPKILTWARATAGLSIDDAARSIQTKPEKVEAWERGEESPSMAQLRKMAAAYKRVLSDFYLPAVPREGAIPHDFRRLPGEVALHYSRALRYQLRIAAERRELALDLADELDSEVPTVDGHLRLDADAEQSGAELRRQLRTTIDKQRIWRDPRAGYNGWRAAIERAGILVFQAVGIPTTEMLGFSLSERPLPVIGVNRKLRPNGRTFTLLHECVHVYLGESSICDIEDGVLRPPEEERVEIFCNAVAAAALVPLDNLLAEPLVRAQPARPRDWSAAELAALSRTFSVSEEVILRRLLTAGRTSQDFYAARRAAWGGLMQDVQPSDPDAEMKRNMPQEVLSDLGRPFTQIVVNSYQNSYTSLSDVTRYLGLKAEKIAKLEELLAGH